jgi:parallel beta-helix repeat protein
MGDGIYIGQFSFDFSTDIRHSVISHNGVDGIRIEANNVRIADNVIDANDAGGVRLTGTASWNSITDNRIIGNSTGVSIGYDANVNLVARNLILGSTSEAVSDVGVGNRIGTFVGGDASITATNPWSNVVY